MLTLAAVGVLWPSAAAAQEHQVLRAAGVEIVDPEGRVRAYFGPGHADSAGLWVHDKREWQWIGRVHSYDDQARIEVTDANGVVRWRAP